MTVAPCTLPSNTPSIVNSVESAFFNDSYRVALRHGDASVIDLFFAIFRHHPAWRKAILKDKRITYASTDRTDELRRVADDFMLGIFDFLPGEYLITDKSSLRDFTEFGSSETSLIRSNVTKLYAIECADVPSEKLVDIFAQNQARRNLQ